MSGCSGGGNVAPTAAAAPSAHTSRVESRPGGGARIFLDNVLVDTITYAADGAAQHDFGGGKTAIDKVPAPKGGIHAEICRVLNDLAAVDFYYRSVTTYNQATMNLFVILGGIAATRVITSGLAGVVLGAGGALAFYQWTTARSDMYAARAALGIVTC